MILSKHGAGHMNFRFFFPVFVYIFFHINLIQNKNQKNKSQDVHYQKYKNSPRLFANNNRKILFTYENMLKILLKKTGENKTFVKILTTKLMKDNFKSDSYMKTNLTSLFFLTLTGYLYWISDYSK